MAAGVDPRGEVSHAVADKARVLAKGSRVGWRKRQKRPWCGDDAYAMRKRSALTATSADGIDGWVTNGAKLSLCMCVWPE